MAVSKISGQQIAETPTGRMTAQLDVGPGPSFQQALLREVPNSKLRHGGATPTAPVLRFSQHAIDRMRSRGVQMSPDLMGRLESGVAKAAAKGSKDTLVLSPDSAFVVSVKNNTVVTVMDRDQMKDNVFTNIDSTVFI